MRVGGFRLPGILALLVVTGVAGVAQVVISTQAGLINFTQDGTRLNNQVVSQERGQFRQMREGDVLTTTRGMAEVLLTPGVFMRIGAGSSFHLVSSRITDARVAIEYGAAVVEAAELGKDNAVTLSYRDAEIFVLKRGIYRLDTSPPVARVFDGKLRIRMAGREIEIGKGKTVALDGSLTVAKFDRKRSDWLDIWSRERAGYLARLNRSSAYSLLDQRGSIRTSGWLWDPAFGLYTFLPGRSYYYCGWYGSCWYSPGWIYNASGPRVSGYGGPTGGGGGSGSSGSSISPGSWGSSSSGGATGSTSRSDPPATSAPAPSRGGGSRGDP